MCYPLALRISELYRVMVNKGVKPPKYPSTAVIPIDPRSVFVIDNKRGIGRSKVRKTATVPLKGNTKRA